MVDLPLFDTLEHAYPAWTVPLSAAMDMGSKTGERRRGRALIVAVFPRFSPLMKPWCPRDCCSDETKVSIGWDDMEPWRAARLGRALVAAADKDTARPRTWFLTRCQRLSQAAHLWDLTTIDECRAVGLALQAAAKCCAERETGLDWKRWAMLNDQQHRQSYEQDLAEKRKAVARA